MENNVGAKVEKAGIETTSISKKTALKADLALLLVAMLWGGGFIAGKSALGCIPPFALLGARFFGAGFLMVILFRKKMKYIPKHTWFSGMMIGTFMFVGMAFQTVGLKYTTASKQAFLIASYTVLVPFISWILTKKKPSFFALLAGAMTLTGVGILSLNSNFSIEFGDALSLLFSVVFGLQIVCIGIFVKNVDMVQFTTIQLITGGILAILASLLFEAPPQSITTEAWFAVFYLLALNTTFAFTVQNIAQRYTSDTHTSIILSLESIFGVIFAILLLGEVFTIRMGIGAIIIFSAVLISTFERK